MPRVPDRVVRVAAVFLLLSCDSGPSAPVVGGGPDGRDGGQAGRTGSSGSGGRTGVAGRDGRDPRDAGMDAGEAMPEPTVDPAAPVVEILEPTAASDPNDDEILTSAAAKVRCRVTRSRDDNARDVDQSLVQIQRLDPSGVAMPVQGAVNALPDNEFEADFQLGELPNGRVRFACSATDVNMPPRTGTAIVNTFLDLGPEVRIIEPVSGSSHALRNPVVIKFEVGPASVSADDEESDPVDVHLFVLGQEFDASEDPDQPGLYTTSVDFDDRELFAMPPSSAEIAVVASSSRTPDAATRRVESDITLDAAGPVISVSSPAHLQIVRGEVQLVVNITDPSGVQAERVFGTINQNVWLLDDWDVSGSTFTERFDTRTTIFSPLTQLTINITAVDSVGNESTASHVLRLDNVPPLLSLDPPMIREYEAGSSICSEAFDPLGDATSDLDVRNASSLYRVLIFERTNGSAGANFSYVAGVADSTVRLFAQGKDIPLLIDTNSDGVCDAINSAALPQADRPVVLSLSPVSPRGRAHYSATADFNAPEHQAAAFCQHGAENAPGSLCPNTPMTRAISQPLVGAPPGVYAFAPTNSHDGPCDGLTWEVLSSVGEGWACLAASAEDNIGNLAVSPPIRVCFDDGDGDVQSCRDPVADPPPSCTDGCAWPDDLAPNLTLLRR